MLSLRRTLSAVVLAALAATPALAQDDTRPTVAIISFSNGAIGPAHAELDPLRVGIVDLLINAMAANNRIRVVERERVQAILAEQGLSRTDNIDKATAVKLGKLLGAHHLITGGFFADPKNNLRLTARSINSETGIIEHTESVRGKGDDVLAAIDQLADRLNSGLKLPPMTRVSMTTPSGAQPGAGEPAAAKAAPAASEPKALDLRTAVLYSRALGHMDAGEKAKAVETFKAVLAKFPEFGPAKEKLARLEQTSGE